jgi:hypothetical protein
VTAVEVQPDALAVIMAKIESLEATVHRLTNAVCNRLEVPADRLTLAEAAKRAGCSARTLEKVAARKVFTDHRRGRTQGAARLYLADEIDVYAAEGEAAVIRYREQMGRN